MRAKLFLAALAFALCFCPLSAAFAAAAPATAAAAKPPADAPTSIDPQVLAKVVPGISKAQLTALLGAPWRTVQYNDLDEVENEFWEYRGKDTQGPYRVHIEFDDSDVARLVAKIPDHAAGNQGTRAKTAPPDMKVAMKM